MIVRLPWTLVRLFMRPTAKHRMPTDDRRILEDVIFRAVYGNPEFLRMLLVGCHQYSRWYPRLFKLRLRTRIETVDMDPNNTIHGAITHHETDFQALARDGTLSEKFDLVVINGVFGYGIDTSSDKVAAMQVARHLLRCGGLLLVGYRAAPFEDFDPDVLYEGFVEAQLPGFTASRVASLHQNFHSFIAFRRLS